MTDGKSQIAVARDTEHYEKRGVLGNGRAGGVEKRRFSYYVINGRPLLCARFGNNTRRKAVSINYIRRLIWRTEGSNCDGARHRVLWGVRCVTQRTGEVETRRFSYYVIKDGPFLCETFGHNTRRKGPSINCVRRVAWTDGAVQITVPYDTDHCERRGVLRNGRVGADQKNVLFRAT